MGWARWTRPSRWLPIIWACAFLAERFCSRPRVAIPDAERARPLIEKGVGDFEHALEIQKPYFDTLGTHPRGELLIGLADGYARLGKDDQATAYFERIRAASAGLGLCRERREVAGDQDARAARGWLPGLPRCKIGESHDNSEL